VYSWQDANLVFHGAVLLGNTVHKFDIPGASSSYGDGINDYRVIDGTYHDQNNVPVGFEATY